MVLISKMIAPLIDSKYRSHLIIFSAALVLRVIFLIMMAGSIGLSSVADLFPDSISYIKAGDHLLGTGNEGEFWLFLTGPGYPFFVALFRLVFGGWVLPVLLVQIILSSLTAVLIYMLSRLIIESRPISFIAGFLAALSITSIELANCVLSETVFLFLFVLSLYLFFRAVIENRLSFFIAAGILGGAAVLIRSAVLFFPPVLILLAWLIPLDKSFPGRGKIMKKALLAAVIMAAIPLLWSARNLSRHDTFIVSGTGLGAAKTYLAILVNFDIQERPEWEFKKVKDSLYEEARQEINTANARKYYNDARDYVLSTLKKYPRVFIRNYFYTILDNITAVSALHYYQLPQYSDFYKSLEIRLYKGTNSYVTLLFSLIGLVVFCRHSRRRAVIPFIIMFYFAIISGVTFWQGSRIFYPAIVAQSILVAATILFLYDLAVLPWRLIRSGRAMSNNGSAEVESDSV